MAGRLIPAGVALLLSAATFAQSDPMRPPAGMAEAERRADGVPAAPAESPVQTVILRKGAKPMALVSGQEVTVGSRLGDARVVSIGETEVVLAGPGGREVLRLHPDVNKRILAPQATAPAAKKRAAGRSKKQNKRDGEHLK